MPSSRLMLNLALGCAYSKSALDYQAAHETFRRFLPLDAQPRKGYAETLLWDLYRTYWFSNIIAPSCDWHLAPAVAVAWYVQRDAEVVATLTLLVQCTSRAFFQRLVEKTGACIAAARAVLPCTLALLVSHAPDSDARGLGQQLFAACYDSHNWGNTSCLCLLLDGCDYMYETEAQASGQPGIKDELRLDMLRTLLSSRKVGRTSVWVDQIDPNFIDDLLRLHLPAVGSVNDFPGRRTRRLCAVITHPLAPAGPLACCTATRDRQQCWLHEAHAARCALIVDSLTCWAPRGVDEIIVEYCEGAFVAARAKR